MLERFFRLRENGTDARREAVAGITTFAAMAYILAVNPAILSLAGIDKGALITATALAAAFTTLAMALLTNYPIALAPGMGLNAFFTFTICLAARVPWPAALGLVFWEGFLFLAAHADRRAAEDRRGHPRQPENGHRLRHRVVHRVHRAEKRRHHRRQPGDVRGPGRFVAARAAAGAFRHPADRRV